MTAAGPAFIFAITTANHNQQEGQQAAEDQRQRPEPIRDDRGPFSFYRQRETAPPLRDTAGTCTGSGGGPPGIPTARAYCPSAYLHTGGFFSYARLKSDPKEKHPPGPPALIRVLNFQAARRSDPGRQEESPPPHARRRKRARYFPAANPITARGARFFPGRERKKSVLFATHCRYFPFFQPKKKSHRAGNARRPAASRGIKNIVTKTTPLKKGPADFENRGEGAGRRHATTAQAGAGAV